MILPQFVLNLFSWNWRRFSVKVRILIDSLETDSKTPEIVSLVQRKVNEVKANKTMKLHLSWFKFDKKMWPETNTATSKEPNLNLKVIFKKAK